MLRGGGGHQGRQHLEKVERISWVWLGIPDAIEGSLGAKVTLLFGSGGSRKFPRLPQVPK